MMFNRHATQRRAREQLSALAYNKHTGPATKSKRSTGTHRSRRRLTGWKEAEVVIEDQVVVVEWWW